VRRGALGHPGTASIVERASDIPSGDGWWTATDCHLRRARFSIIRKYGVTGIPLGSVIRVEQHWPLSVQRRAYAPH
jgi:hypothetical protein